MGRIHFLESQNNSPIIKKEEEEEEKEGRHEKLLLWKTVTNNLNNLPLGPQG